MRENLQTPKSTGKPATKERCEFEEPLEKIQGFWSATISG